MDLFIQYIAIIYLRLSNDDGDTEKDSNSIENQEKLIRNYLKDFPEIEIYKVYKDDGYTGTNFTRPGFNQMYKDLCDQKANMVIVKDLSRFGRDYVETGRYIKKEFRKTGIRFISVLDSFDSLTATSMDYNLLLPVKNFVNDQYSSDISIKVRSNQKAMRSEGLYIGPYVGYGRKKDPKDKHKIIIDEYAAGIIRDMIDDLYWGYTVNKISERLNRRGINAPAEHKRDQGIKFKTSFQKHIESSWTPTAVTRAMLDPMNIGIIEQGKRQRINYKLRVVEEKPYQDQDIKEDAVPPIITRYVYDNVKRLLLMDLRPAPGMDRVYMFGGLIYCGDCGHSMARRKISGSVQYICSGYNKKTNCTRHAVFEHDLYEIVLSVLQKQISAVLQLDDFLKDFRPNDSLVKKMETYDMELKIKYRKLDAFENLKSGLSELKKDKLIDEEEFQEQKAYYEGICKNVENSIIFLKERIRFFAENIGNNMDWVDEFLKFGTIKELNRPILVSMVDKILIYEDKRVEVHFLYSDEFSEMEKYVHLIKQFQADEIGEQVS